MSNERIAEIEEILKTRNPKTTLGLRKELGRLLEAEVTQSAPPVVEAPKPKKTKKTKKS